MCHLQPDSTDEVHAAESLVNTKVAAAAFYVFDRQNVNVGVPKGCVLGSWFILSLYKELTDSFFYYYS